MTKMAQNFVAFSKKLNLKYLTDMSIFPRTTLEGTEGVLAPPPSLEFCDSEKKTEKRNRKSIANSPQAPTPRIKQNPIAVSALIY